MSFLRRLFGGGPAEPQDQSGLYYYIRNRRSGEVIRLRLDVNQLTPEFEGERISGYYARKVVVGSQSFERIEAEFAFDANKRLRDRSVSREGEFVDEAAWRAQQTD